jgi:Kinesin motor domain
VLTIYVAQKEKDNGMNSWLTVVSAKILLVDLAGSELVGKSYLVGKQLEEAKIINKSLSALGLVIAALTTRAASSVHIPYRNSKLTRILQDSLGGTSKLSLIMTVSPSLNNANETLSTLRFGLRAKLMQSRTVKNVHRISTGGSTFGSGSTISSGSSVGNSPSKYNGNTPMNRMSTGSLRDAPPKAFNHSIGRISDESIQTTLRRAERMLDVHSVEILAFNAQLDSIETKKILESFSHEELLVNLACDGEYDIILSPVIKSESRKSLVLSSSAGKAASTLSPVVSMENLDLTVILAETNDTHIGYSPNSCYTPDGENAGNESDYTAFTPQLSEEQLAPDVTFLEPYLDTNLIYKCLDFQEIAAPIDTLGRSPTHALQMTKARNLERASLNVDTGHTGIAKSLPPPKNKCYSFAEFQREWKGTSGTESVPSGPVPAVDPVSTAKITDPAYGSFEGADDHGNHVRSDVNIDDDLTTKLAKQLAVESITVSAVTALLNVERETVAKLTKEIAILTKASTSSPAPRPSPGSTVMDRSVHADVEEEKLSALLSQQLKAQNVQLRVLSQELLTQKIFASTVSEKLSRVQASSAGATMSLNIERGSVELLVNSLRDRIMQLSKEADEKDKIIASYMRSRMDQKMESKDYIPLIPSPTFVTSNNPDSQTSCAKARSWNDVLVADDGSAGTPGPRGPNSSTVQSAVTPGPKGPNGSTVLSEYIVDELNAVNSPRVSGVERSAFRSNERALSTRNKVLSVVAAIEQKCSSRPTSTRFDDSNATAMYHGLDGIVYDRLLALSSPAASTFKGDMQSERSACNGRVSRPSQSKVQAMASRLPLAATHSAPITPMKSRQAGKIQESEVESINTRVDTANALDLQRENYLIGLTSTANRDEVAPAYPANTNGKALSPCPSSTPSTPYKSFNLSMNMLRPPMIITTSPTVSTTTSTTASTTTSTSASASVVTSPLQSRSPVGRVSAIPGRASRSPLGKLTVTKRQFPAIVTTADTTVRTAATPVAPASEDPCTIAVTPSTPAVIADSPVVESVRDVVVIPDCAPVTSSAVSNDEKHAPLPTPGTSDTVSLVIDAILSVESIEEGEGEGKGTLQISAPTTAVIAKSENHRTSNTHKDGGVKEQNLLKLWMSGLMSFSASMTSVAAPALLPLVVVDEERFEPTPTSISTADKIDIERGTNVISESEILEEGGSETVEGAGVGVQEERSELVVGVKVQGQGPDAGSLEGVTSPVKKVLSFEIQSTQDDIPTSNSLYSRYISANTVNNFSSSRQDAGDTEEKDHIPEITLYHSGDSDTSMNLGDVRDYIDHIPLSIPEQDDSFIGKECDRTLLSPFKSTGSGRFAKETL